MLDVLMENIVRKMTRQLSRYAMAIMTTFALLFMPLSIAYAQSSDVQALLDRINRMEADLNNVQRKVYQGRDIPASGATVGSSPKLGGEAAAVLSSRIDGIEDEQRRMTGSSEEVSYQLNQLKTRLDKLVLDIDYRLSAIESQLTGGQTGQVNVGNAQNAPTSNWSESNSALQQPVRPETPSGNLALGGELPQGTKLLGTLRAPSNTAGQSSAQSINNTATPAALETSVAAVQPVGSPSDQYNRAMGLIRKDDYIAAEQAFMSFLEGNRKHALAGNAQYWLGETYYVRGDYSNAASSFLNGYQNYPDNAKAADNLLKLAMTLGRMEQVEEACATFQQLSKQFKDLPSRLKRIADRERVKFNCS
ncbi:tol-pal system protein YbgF [Alphaproteobacteria bacterium 46_93_T64]|nr:tol-pal system protein YbgF [Alphaproteobacteria bacterium 46_93_T64]